MYASAKDDMQIYWINCYPAKRPLNQMEKMWRGAHIRPKKCKDFGLFVQKSVILPSGPSNNAYAQKENRRDIASMEESARS